MVKNTESLGLSNRTLVQFSLPACALTLMAMNFYLYLPKFYADVVGVDLTALGVVILCSRVWDAVLDPLIGTLSDRTRSRWGRRKPWIGFSAVPLSVIFFFLGTPPESLTQLQALTWFSALTFMFFVTWTACSIPYEAWGTELSTKYAERNKLFAFRDGALIVGTLLAALIPVLLQMLQADARTVQLVVSWVYTFACLTAVPILLHGVRERRSDVAITPGARGGLISLIRRNKPFRILLISYTISAIGSWLPATLMLFYVEYVLGSKHASIFLLIYFLIGFAVLPLWVKLSARIDKRNTWLVAMSINTGAFSLIYWIGPNDVTAYGILVCVSALGYGATLAIPSSMQADVIDYDELLTGSRREGFIVGVWSIARKLAAALGSGLAFPILDYSGYVVGGPQPPSAIATLTFLYAAVPSICNLVGICVATQYPINQAFHQSVSDRLAATHR